MKNIFLFLIYLFVSNIFAQPPKWVNFTNGNKVFRIVDTGDVLWIGTDGGLVKFNKTMKNLTYYNRANAGLPGNHIYSLAIDMNGKVWIGDRDYGIGVFDGEKCFVFNANNSALPLDQWNTAIAIDHQNRKWIGSLYYLSIFDGQNWKTYRVGDILSPFTIIKDIKFDSKRNAWIGGTWGLSKFEGNSLIEKYKGFDKEINAIYIDSGDCLWLATNRAGLVKFCSDTFVYYDSTNSDIPSNTVYDVKGDSKGNIWLATTKGLAKFDGSQWQIFNKNSGLPVDVIFTIEIDKKDENIIWLGTWKKGLIKFKRKEYKIYKLSNSILPSNNINDICVDKKNKVWIGTTAGLVSYDGLSWNLLNTDNSGLKNNFITALFVDSTNDLWIGARDSFCLTKFDGQNWLVFDSTNSIFTREWVIDINMDKKGELWISTKTAGLIRYSSGKWTRYTTFNSNLTSNTLDHIAIDDSDNVWVGMINNPCTGGKGGLAKYNGNDFIIYNNKNSDIPYENIFSPFFDSKGNLWFVSSETNLSVNLESILVKFDGKNFTIFSKPENSSLSVIYIDSYNNLWIGGKGFLKFDGNNEWIYYDVLNSGLADNKIQTISIDYNQNVWIGHFSSGISIFRENGVLLDTNINYVEIPKSIIILQNYPNPFNDNTTIEYEIKKLGVVRLEIYNEIGQKIKRLINHIQYPGKYKVNWDGKDFNGKNCPSGIYLCCLKIDGVRKTKKMVLLR